MRRLAMIAAVLALAGCSGEGGEGEQPTTTAGTSALSTTSTTSPTTQTPTAVVLGEVDIYTCQQFVASDSTEEAYDWLLLVEREGASAGLGLGTPGYLQVYNLGGTASLFTTQLESPVLATAMRAVEEEGMTVKQTIDIGARVRPAPLIEALDGAAGVCEEGGFTVDWN